MGVVERISDAIAALERAETSARDMLEMLSPGSVQWVKVRAVEHALEEAMALLGRS